MILSKIKSTLVAAAIGVCSVAAQQPGNLAALDGNVNFIVANDLGRNGYYDQKPIAELMGTVAEQIDPEAVLALGDTHHFDGVQSISDPLWMTNYELIYSHPDLMIEWCAILGNHEYRGNSQAVLDYANVSRRWSIPSRYYARTWDDDGISVKVVFLDTTPLIEKYHKKTDTYPDAGKQDAEAQLKWLDETLSASSEDWVVVVGHHPIYAYTTKPDTERADMQKNVDTILKKHRVDMYICGHIHNFQHIRHDGSDIDYVVNSSGSLSRDIEPTEGTQFCSGAPGFSVLSASSKTLSLYMIDNSGNIIHTITRSK